MPRKALLILCAAAWACSPSFAQDVSPPTDLPTGEAPAPAGAPVPDFPMGQKTHTVVDGDTLWDLSTRYLESPWRWIEIWEANKFEVTNPHWIFPGQIIRIPPIVLPPLETPPTPIQPELPVMKLTPPEKGPLPSVRIVPSVEKPREIVYSGLLGTGFVTQEEYDMAPRVAGTMDGRRLMGQGDDIYLEFEEEVTVRKGDQHLIVRVGDELEHPETGEDLGYRVDVLGVIQILDLSSEAALARVLVSYDYISVGDLVIPKQDVPERVAVKKARKGMEGFIVASKDAISFLGQGHIVFVDLNSTTGVQSGELYNIVRTQVEVAGLEVPPVKVGELVVLRVGNAASTALITRSNMPVQIGDHLRAD